MTKSEYLTQLKLELFGLSEADINEIIRDQEEYITDAINSGRKEDEVIASLGPVKALASELKAGHTITAAVNEEKLLPKANKVLKAILALCVLAPFNLIFVLGPFLGLCGVIIAFWSVSGASVAVGFSGLGFAIHTLPHMFLSLAIVFGSLTFIGVGILLLSACYSVTLWILKGVLQYLRWNMKIISGESL